MAIWPSTRFARGVGSGGGGGSLIITQSQSFPPIVPFDTHFLSLAQLMN